MTIVASASEFPIGRNDVELMEKTIRLTPSPELLFLINMSVWLRAFLLRLRIHFRVCLRRLLITISSKILFEKNRKNRKNKNSK